jgi:hypothetical protein
MQDLRHLATPGRYVIISAESMTLAAAPMGWEQGTG